MVGRPVLLTNTGGHVDVQLISYTPDPEVLAAAAARLCYRDTSAADIMRDLRSEEIDHLLDITISSGHHSVIEHISFTFAIDGVSRVLTHQLVRHRVGIAFSQQSQRYASLAGAEWVTPRSIGSDPARLAAFDALMQQSFRLYVRFRGEGVPLEDARFLLPQGVSTRIVMTANLRQLIHMYSINACFRSQWEFRWLMQAIKREMRRVTPRLARELKIKCFASGYCDEAHMCDELSGRMPRKGDLARLDEGAPLRYEQLAESVGEQ
jgi:thymidylate synthase (FAD)